MHACGDVRGQVAHCECIRLALSGSHAGSGRANGLDVENDLALPRPVMHRVLKRRPIALPGIASTPPSSLGTTRVQCNAVSAGWCGDSRGRGWWSQAAHRRTCQGPCHCIHSPPGLYPSATCPPSKPHGTALGRPHLRRPSGRPAHTGRTWSGCLDRRSSTASAGRGCRRSSLLSARTCRSPVDRGSR